MDLRTLNEKLSIMAEKDALTGLFNRGKTEQLLYNMLDDSADDNTPVSLGVITVQGDNEYRSIFSKVDRALYDAKEGGRNRVVRV